MQCSTNWIMRFVVRCETLEALPPLAGLSRLWRLQLAGCTSLAALPQSIGCLTSEANHVSASSCPQPACPACGACPAGGACQSPAARPWRCRNLCFAGEAGHMSASSPDFLYGPLETGRREGHSHDSQATSLVEFTISISSHRPHLVGLVLSLGWSSLARQRCNSDLK